MVWGLDCRQFMDARVGEPARVATRLSINAALLKQARALDINPSATLESASHLAVRERQLALWKLEHQQAIGAYNAEVELRGAFGDRLRGI
jgi:antitoxin CcdA